MPSKWEGVPIGLVPFDERACEQTRRDDEAEKKKRAESGEVSPNVIAKVPTDDEESHVDESRQSIMKAMTRMNVPSIYSKGIHSGMTTKYGAQNVNKRRVPDSPEGTQMVAKQTRERPMPIIRSNEEERLRQELNVARKQHELDEEDKDSMRETIEMLRKENEELKKRDIVTEEMQLELAMYHRAQQKRREREKRFIERHSKER